MPWVELKVSCAREDAERCADVLMEHGCAGAQIDDVAVVLDESEDATLAPKEQATVTGYLESDAPASTVQAEVQRALAGSGISAEATAAPVEEQDWSTSWQQNFPPLRIGPFLIAPPWEDVAPHEQDGAIPIVLDPGLAFGTGQHPTTRMCLELLGEWLGQERLPRGTALLDVGCGSGILSIAAAKLGARPVCSDLDPFCVNATKENAGANDVSLAIVQAAGTDWTRQQFPLVVANLMSALLITLAPALAGATQAGGTLIISGISSPRADDVQAALHEAGFTTIEKREMDGDQRGDFTERWTAFVMQKLLK